MTVSTPHMFPRRMSYQGVLTRPYSLYLKAPLQSNLPHTLEAKTGGDRAIVTEGERDRLDRPGSRTLLKFSIALS